MRRGYVALLGVWLCHGAAAHSASDAYLTLTVENSATTRVLHGQWDIALRDLDFVLDLDREGRGGLTWGEVRRRRPQIEAYAYQHLRFAAGAANHCVLRPLRQMIDQHADGAYAALIFDVICVGGPAPLTLDYSLFFDIDPSHRAIYVGRSGADIATAVLAPQNSKIDLH
jgi:hypothetical protein